MRLATINAMRREEWEQDLRERQRNIVFPDTVRNEGNFYRSLVHSKTPLSGVHRFGLGLLGTSFLMMGCVGLSAAIAHFIHPESEISRWLTMIFVGAISVGSCLFGGLMVFRAVLPAAPPASSAPVKNHRRGGKVRIKK